MGWGVNDVSHILYFLFLETLALRPLGVKSFVKQQDYAPQDSFFIIYFAAQSKLGLKISE
jgi:hypothetical protein